MRIKIWIYTFYRVHGAEDIPFGLFSVKLLFFPSFLSFNTFEITATGDINEYAFIYLLFGLFEPNEKEMFRGPKNKNETNPRSQNAKERKHNDNNR